MLANEGLSILSQLVKTWMILGGTFKSLGIFLDFLLDSLKAEPDAFGFIASADCSVLLLSLYPSF